MEIIALLSTAKELGLDTGNIVVIIIMGFVIKKDLSKNLSLQIDKIVDAIKVHNDRFETIESDVKHTKIEIIEIKKTIDTITTKEKEC